MTDLTSELGVAQSTVLSTWPACATAHWLTCGRSGRASVYSLAQPALLDLFTAAEEVLAATGNAVALCPAYGQPR